MKAEISFVADQAWKIFYYSIIFCAAFFGWLVTNRKVIDHVSWHVIIWIPTLLSLASVALNAGLYVRVIEIGRYIRKLEKQMAHKDLGWEKDVESRIAKLTAIFMKRGISRTASMMTVCSVLFIATNVLFAYLLWDK